MLTKELLKLKIKLKAKQLLDQDETALLKELEEWDSKTSTKAVEILTEMSEFKSDRFVMSGGSCKECGRPY